MARRIDSDGRGTVDLGSSSRTSVTRVTACANACHGSDGSGGYLTDDADLVIGDINAPGVIGGDCRRQIEVGAGGGAAVAGITGRAVACKCRNVPVRCDHSHTEVAAIRDIDISSTVYRDALRRIQLGFVGSASVA